jgi:intein-encoded DNA endonuclease-like protein
VNKDFFKKWTPEMAYVLGFFAADGNVMENKRGGHFFSLQITDKDIVYKIRELLESNHTIGVRVGVGNEKTKYRLQIGSKEMCVDLRNLGMEEQKTYTMALPSVPEKYLFDFVRGYFDGDGNVWVGQMNKERKTKRIVIQTGFTSCSHTFLLGLKARLEKHEIKGFLSCRKGYSRLYYSIQGSLELYRLMYHKGINELYLPRKKVIFEKFKKMRP